MALPAVHLSRHSALGTKGVVRTGKLCCDSTEGVYAVYLKGGHFGACAGVYVAAYLDIDAPRGVMRQVMLVVYAG